MVGTAEVFDDVTKLTSVLYEDPTLIVDPNIRTALPPAHFGMLGITHDQTARLNVVARPVTGDVSPGPCRVTLSFRDSNGNPLSEFSLAKTLLPGQSTFFDQVVVEDPNIRKEIRPVVRVLANPPTVPACRGVVGTVEVFDVTGVTSVLFVDPELFLP